MASLSGMMNICSCLWSQRQVWVLAVSQNQVTAPVTSFYTKSLDFSKIYMNWMTAWCSEPVSDFLNITRLGNDCSVCLLRDVRPQVECSYPQLLNVSLFCTFTIATVCSQVVKVTNQQIWGTCCPVMVHTPSLPQQQIKQISHKVLTVYLIHLNEWVTCPLTEVCKHVWVPPPLQWEGKRVPVIF